MEAVPYLDAFFSLDGGCGSFGSNDGSGVSHAVESCRGLTKVELA